MRTLINLNFYFPLPISPYDLIYDIYPGITNIQNKARMQI